MATRSLNVQITGDARSLNKVLDQTEGRAKRWGGNIAKGFAVAGAAAGAGLAVGLKKSADAAIESEKSQARMVTQLRASGISWRAHRDEIDEVIQKHSKLSGLDDEDLQDAFTNIVRVTGDVDKGLRLTGLAADFARAKHMDVAKAGELVGKVAGGNTGILSRYGIQVEKGATAQEALALLQEKFAGQAESYGKTTAGALDRAGVASENLGEIVGAKLTPLVAKGADALVGLVDKAGKLAGPIRTASGAVGNALNRIGNAFSGGNDDATKFANAIGRVSRRVIRLIGDIVEEIADLVNSGGQDWGKAARNALKFAGIVAEMVDEVTKETFPQLLESIRRITRVVRSMVTTTQAILEGDWKKAWKGARNTVEEAVLGKTGIEGILRDGIDPASRIGRAIGRAFSRGVIRGLGSLPDDLKKRILDAVSKATRGALSGLGELGRDFGKDLAKNILPGGDGIGRRIAGFVGGTGAGLDGADADLGPFARIGASEGLQVSSGMRGGAITLSGNQSYHATGDAIDMVGPIGAMRRAAARIRRLFGSRIRELISPFPELGIKDGRPYRYSAGIQAQHSGANAHVHVAYTGPFGDGIGQAASAARSAGFRGNDLLTAIAIAGPESGYRNSARLVTSAEDSRGMWQINTYAHPWARGLNLRNPTVAARAAYRVYREAGHSFRPWTAFTAGTYRSYLDDARRAVGSSSRSRRRGGGMSAAEREYIEAMDNAAVRQGVAVREAGRRGGPAKGNTGRTGPAKGFPAGEHPEVEEGDPNQPLIDAITAQMEQAERLAEEQRRRDEERIAVEREFVANQKLIFKLTSQGDTVVAAVSAAVSGYIGGRVGLGLQSPSFAGGVARN